MNFNALASSPGQTNNVSDTSDDGSDIDGNTTNDPNVITARRNIEAKLAVVEANRAQKDFQVGSTLYGGIEDITDNTKGLALSVDASRLVFAGGKLDSQLN